MKKLSTKSSFELTFSGNASLSVRVLMVFLMMMVLTSSADAARVKDLGRLSGTQDLRLLGYGLIVGLESTGDSKKSLFTNQSLTNMLERFGIAVDGEKVNAKNVAAVMVTAEVSSFNKEGGRFDVLVSSLGDAKSLQGGVLLQTTMSDLTGKLWGVATGPVSIGGFNIEAGNVSVRKNYTAVGRVPEGGMLMNDVSTGITDTTNLVYLLREGDFTTAKRMVVALNNYFGDNLAKAIDPVSISIAVPDSLATSAGVVSFIADVENVRFDPDNPARIIINERTGTIVIGEEVTISTVAISHGTLQIQIKSTPSTSQPQAFSAGETVSETVSDISIKEESTGVVVIPQTSTVGDIATALNRLGVTPRDIISIFQALNRAGALQAELVII